MPGTVTVIGNIAMNKNKVPYFMDLTSKWRKQETNIHIPMLGHNLNAKKKKSSKIRERSERAVCYLL